jgi:hypothetical protein
LNKENWSYPEEGHISKYQKIPPHDAWEWLDFNLSVWKWPRYMYFSYSLPLILWKAKGIPILLKNIMENSMQLGIATSSYIHRVVTRFLITSSFPHVWGCNFPSKSVSIHPLSPFILIWTTFGWFWITIGWFWTIYQIIIHLNRNIKKTICGVAPKAPTSKFQISYTTKYWSWLSTEGKFIHLKKIVHSNILS